MKQNLANITTRQTLSTRQLPSNFLAEQMVLTCLVDNLESIETTLEQLPKEAFYFKNHQEIYKAIGLMYQNQIPIDFTTLLDVLQAMGQLEKIGGAKVLLELFNKVTNVTYLEEYISLVKDKFLRRSLIQLGYELINSSYLTTSSLEQILLNTETKLLNLSNSIETKKLISTSELLSTVFLELKDRVLQPSNYGLNCGFYDLDSLTQGFQKSDLIILAGRPSIGKTAFGLNIIMNIVKQTKLPVVFFSLEMAREQIIYRLLSMETNINTSRLKTGRLYQSDWIKLNKMIQVLSRLPLFIDDSSNLSLSDISLKLQTLLVNQQEIGLIVIDYLQLINSIEDKSDNRVQELSKITRGLKILAGELKVPIIALSQLNRSVETRIDKRPILADLKESGSIEQDADVVLMLNPDPSPNSLDETNQTQIIEVIVAKQRNGPVGTIKLKFDKTKIKFLDIEPSSDTSV